MSNLKIGLFGYGCVGQGLYEVLLKSKNIKAEIRSICVKQKNKKRNIDTSIFSYNKWDILNNPDIDVVVELIDDAEEAFSIVSESLKRGKAVVTANKKMIAENFRALIQLQETYQTPVLYEAAVSGSIPIIRTLEEYYNTDYIQNISGIFNGTSNYILTQTQQQGKNYEEALHAAKIAGFAESNPTLDVEGFDSKFKLTILLNHTFGLSVLPKQVLNSGIQNLNKTDTLFATRFGYQIKLLAQAYKTDKGVAAFVLPHLLRNTHSFFHIYNEFNAVQVEGIFNNKQLLTGKGAGGFPTAAAVISDLSSLIKNYKYPYNKLKQNDLHLDNSETIAIYLRYNKKEIMNQLKFEKIYSQFEQENHTYCIGEISIKELIKADINKNKEVFIASIELPLYQGSDLPVKTEQILSIH